MSLLLAGRVDAFDAIETEHYCFEHFGDGFCLFALELVEHASQLHYFLPMQGHVRKHFVQMPSRAALCCLNSIGWLRLALPLRVHCCVWGGGDVATLTELKL